MQERFDTMMAYYTEHSDKYLYSDKNTSLGNNVLLSYTVSDANIDNYNLVIETLVKEKNFDWFIKKIKADADRMFEDNEKASNIKQSHDLKAWSGRQGCNKYSGTNNRKKLRNMATSSGERMLENKIYSNYLNMEDPIIGNSVDYQIPMMREANGKRAIDLVFKKGNTIYVVELKDLTSHEGIIRCICEVLTYYYLMRRNIEKDGNDGFFFKKCLKEFYNPSISYDIQPAIVCPKSFIKGINLDILLSKLFNEHGIDLKIVTISDTTGNLDK